MQAEIAAAATDVRLLREELSSQAGLRRFVAQCFDLLEGNKGASNGHHFVDRFVLRHAKNGFEWSWCVTPHYPVVSKIPADPTYVARGLEVARSHVKALVLETAEFERRLALAWQMARHFSNTDEVFVTDVMKLFQVAGQDARFWQNPKRAFYKDLPEAAFVVNLIDWRARVGLEVAPFTFVPATLSQTSGQGRKVFYMPMNAAGTERQTHGLPPSSKEQLMATHEMLDPAPSKIPPARLLTRRS